MSTSHQILMIDTILLEYVYTLVATLLLGDEKKHIVSRSNTKAEFPCLANAAIELIWLASLFKELKIHLPKSLVLWCENLGVVHLSANPIQYSRT